MVIFTKTIALRIHQAEFVDFIDYGFDADVCLTINSEDHVMFYPPLSIRIMVFIPSFISLAVIVVA